jgi:hypothetical protein
MGIGVKVNGVGPVFLPVLTRVDEHHIRSADAVLALSN